MDSQEAHGSVMTSGLPSASWVWASLSWVLMPSFFLIKLLGQWIMIVKLSETSREWRWEHEQQGWAGLDQWQRKESVILQGTALPVHKAAPTPDHSVGLQVNRGVGESWGDKATKSFALSLSASVLCRCFSRSLFSPQLILWMIIYIFCFPLSTLLLPLPEHPLWLSWHSVTISWWQNSSLYSGGKSNRQLYSLPSSWEALEIVHSSLLNSLLARVTTFDSAFSLLPCGSQKQAMFRPLLRMYLLLNWAPLGFPSSVGQLLSHPGSKLRDAVVGMPRHFP